MDLKIDCDVYVPAVCVDCQNLRLIAGMVNSAAVYTHAWRGGNAMASLNEWATALTKANSPNVYVSVVPAG